MAEYICPNCGNNALRNLNGDVVTNPKAIDVNSQYFCTECGEELSKEHLSQLLVASANETTFEYDLRSQAMNAKMNGDYENALALYQQLGMMKPDDWSAAFYTVYCNCYNAVGAIENACEAMKGCLDGVFDKIDNLYGVEKQNAVKFVVSDAGLFALHMFDSAVQQHAALDVNTMNQHTGVLRNQLTSALNIAIACASNVMNRYGDDDEVAALVELPATCALQMQSRQSYVTLLVNANTNKTLLEWIGRFNPQYVEAYKAKQNRAMRNGTIALVVFAAIFFAIGYFVEGEFADWFGYAMAALCGVAAIFRIIVQVANKILNG